MTNGEHIRETFAHFGAAVYFAQILEQGIVNAMVISRLPHKDRITRADIDAFMDQQFQHTLGRLIRDLRREITIPQALEDLLTRALNKRNWLCHACWREHTIDFAKRDGREAMTRKFQEIQQLLQEADKALAAAINPLRERGGVTDEQIALACKEIYITNGIGD